MSNKAKQNVGVIATFFTSILVPGKEVSTGNQSKGEKKQRLVHFHLKVCKR